MFDLENRHARVFDGLPSGRTHWAASYFALGTAQQPTGIAYTTDGARISPQWSWRQALRDANAS